MEYEDINHADFLPWQAHVGETAPDLNMEILREMFSRPPLTTQDIYNEIDKLNLTI